MGYQLAYAQFRDFLKQQNCEDEFDRAFYEQNGCTRFDAALWNTVEDAAEDVKNLFGYAFNWSKTSEGIQFWRSIDLMWYNYYICSRFK
ncbi:MAG: hypothetical protein LKM37_08280 [Bacteroidales bacterium]|jgi:hypothetical protein|nr:hypothetical protein [Bacteroidales bacterium]